ARPRQQADGPITLDTARPRRIVHVWKTGLAFGATGHGRQRITFVDRGERARGWTPGLFERRRSRELGVRRWRIGGLGRAIACIRCLRSRGGELRAAVVQRRT